MAATKSAKSGDERHIHLGGYKQRRLEVEKNYVKKQPLVGRYSTMPEKMDEKSGYEAPNAEKDW